MCYVAVILGVAQQSIADVIKNTEKRQLSEFGKNFKPYGLLRENFNQKSGESCKSEAFKKKVFFALLFKKLAICLYPDLYH